MKSLRHFSPQSSTLNGLFAPNFERVVKKAICLTLVALAIASYALAQAPARQVVNQHIQWAFLSSTIKVNPKTGIFLEQQLGFAQGQNMQHVFRAAVDYSVSKKLSVMPFGYAYAWNYIYGKQPASVVNNERALWQQVVYKQTVLGAAVSHRLRFEERFIQAHTMTTTEGLVNSGFTNKQFRVRYRAQVNVGLNKKKIGPKTVYASVWDEVFMSWGKVVTYHKPDQNRLFVGAGYQATKDLTFQAGFYDQTVVKSNGARQENNSGVLVQLNYNLSLK